MDFLALTDCERAHLVVQLALYDHARIPATAGRGRCFDRRRSKGKSVVELASVRSHALSVLIPKLIDCIVTLNGWQVDLQLRSQYVHQPCETAVTKPLHGVEVWFGVTPTYCPEG